MKKTMLIPLLILLILLSYGTAVAAQTGFWLSQSVLAGGGGSLQNGSYQLTGTTGQAEAEPALANGKYALRGGFWQGDDPVGGLPQKIFVPVFIR